jgi:hypothetical protein
MPTLKRRDATSRVVNTIPLSVDVDAGWATAIDRQIAVAERSGTCARVAPASRVDQLITVVIALFRRFWTRGAHRFML